MRTLSEMVYTHLTDKPTMSERAEQIAKDLDLEAKLRFYENWAEAVINGYFVFSDGSELEVPVK